MPSDEEGVLPSVFGGWSLEFTLSWRGNHLLNFLLTFGGTGMSVGLLSTLEPLHIIKLYFKVCGTPVADSCLGFCWRVGWWGVDVLDGTCFLSFSAPY